MDELRSEGSEETSRSPRSETIGQVTHPAAENSHPSFDGPVEEAVHPVPRRLIATVLLLVALGGAVDVALDDADWRSGHVVLELAVMALSLGLAIHLWRGWLATSRSLRHARRTLAERNAERDAWRARAQRALAGLAAEIDAHLAAWQLTPTEREVALLLLEGLGHKQIAARTNRSERTVRQHGIAIYEKAGVSGRAELAAFFLSGLASARRADADQEGTDSTSGIR